MEESEGSWKVANRVGRKWSYVLIMVIIWCDGSVDSFCSGNQEINTVCTFNLHNIICKLYLDKAEGKNQTRKLKKKKSLHCLDHLIKPFQDNLYFIHVEERSSFVLSHKWAITIFFSLAVKYNEMSIKYALLVAQTVKTLPASAGDLG